MRTNNNTIGYKIIDIVYEHQPYGIGRNELVRVSGFAKNTIDRWIAYLRNFGIIKQTLEYPILLTELSIQKYRKNSLLLPLDSRRKNTIKIQKNIWSEKDKKSIILILSLMALGVYKPRKYHKPKAGLVEIRNPFNPQQFFMYGGKTIHSVSLNDVVSRISTKNPGSPNKKAFLPNTKINYGNNELFGYLNLTLEEAQRIFDKLLNHNPQIIKPLKIKCKTQSEIRYTIADDLRKEFVTNCILSFNLCVNDRLEYAYIYDLFYNLKIKEQSTLLTKGEQLKKYKEYMQIWYGIRRKTHRYFTMMDKRKKELNIKNNEKSELTKHYKKVIDERDKIIKERHLFDDKFENVNDKYKPLLDKYGFIVNTFLELLFPHFLREIWKRKNLFNI